MTSLESAIEAIVERVIDRKLSQILQQKTPAEFRIEGGFHTATAAAKASGVSTDAILRMESGKYHHPREIDSKCARLAKVYGCDAAELQKAAVRVWQSMKALKAS